MTTEADETEPLPQASAPQLQAIGPVPSHRGVGAVAPSRGAFSTTLAQRTTPPGSVTITADLAADAPPWQEQTERFDIATPGDMPDTLQQLMQTTQRLDLQQHDFETHVLAKLNTLSDIVNAYASRANEMLKSPDSHLRS